MREDENYTFKASIALHNESFVMGTSKYFKGVKIYF